MASSEGPIDIGDLTNEQQQKLTSLITQRVPRDSNLSNDEDVQTFCQYVVVMVQNKKTRSQVASELEVFLGPKSSAFAEW